MSAEAPELQADLSPRKLLATLAILAGATVLAAGLCSLVGQAELNAAVWRLRVYRLLAGATVGAALGAAGVAAQGLLRNALAEPYILGLSSGAGVGVLAGYALAGAAGLAGWATTPLLAAGGAMAACLVVYGIAQRRGRLDPYALILSGVIVNAFNGAVMLAIFLVVPPRTITSFAAWAMGRLTDSIALSSGAMVAVCVVCAVGGWVALFLRGSALNALALGDDVAASSGVAVHRLRVELFAVVSLMTAAAVSLAGPIGFLGLIVPHICRLIVGPDHRRLILVSGFAGAIFLMAADTFCRTAGEWVRVGEIPVGILTALCGGPFFIVLLRRRLREGEA